MSAAAEHAETLSPTTYVEFKCLSLLISISHLYYISLTYHFIDLTTSKMDTKNENKKYRNTPEWAEYQRENFWKVNEGEVPIFNTGRSYV